MLYICILSNKFDLKQTIRVLHNSINHRSTKLVCLPRTNLIFTSQGLYSQNFKLLTIILRVMTPNCKILN